MQTIKIRNLTSAEDNTLTDNSYLALALNDNDTKLGSEDPQNVNQRITVKTTISQLRKVILPTIGDSPPVSENEEGGIDVGIGDVILDENGDALVPQPPVVIKQGGKDQIKITDDRISLKENVTIEKTLLAIGGVTTLGPSSFNGITTFAGFTNFIGPTTFSDTTTFNRDAFFNELTNDPSPTEGKIYRKSDGLYFNGSKLLTEGQGGKWIDGDSSGDIVYNAGKVGIGTTSPSAELEIGDGTGGAKAIKIKSGGGTSGDLIFDSASDEGMLRYEHTTDSMRFHTNGSEQVRIDSSGNVVFAGPNSFRSTSNADYKLDVSGSGRFIDWCTSYRTTHTDGRYANSDYYLLLLQYDTRSYVSGELTGFRGGSTAQARTLHTTFQANSTSYKASGQTEGIMMMSKGPGMFANQDRMKGFYSVVYNGNKYLALHFEPGTLYHAMTWEFQGRIKLETSENEANFLKVIHMDDLSEITAQAQYTTINHDFYALDKKIGIGNAAPGYKLDVNGDINFTGDLYKDGVLFVGGGGSSNISDVTGLQAALDNKLDKPAANSEPTFVDSDINLKTNISPIESPIKSLESIRGVNFEWKKESNKSGEDQGLIAQEVEKIIPSAVKKGEDGYLKVDYTKLVPFLLEAVKDLSKRVKELEKN